jgi:arylesterase/paraoxonase
MYVVHMNSNNSRINHLNASGRALTDRIAILDTRSKGRLASRIKWITLENFAGVNGEAILDLHGLDIRADKHTDMLRILLVNHRPPVDPITGEYLDASVVGANSTIEQFLTKAGTTTMRHIKTFAHPLIHTPNRVAWVTDTSFVISNDHSGKVGLVSTAALFLINLLLTLSASPSRSLSRRRKHCLLQPP